MNKTRLIKQIPVTDIISEYKKLIHFLKDKNYNIAYYLLDLNDDDRYVAILVDLQEKDVWASNVTCMAAWCRNGTRYPLNVREFIENYDEFVINDNFNKYNEMIENKARKR